MQKLDLLNKLGFSKRFLAALAVLALAAINQKLGLGLSDDTLKWLIAGAAGYIAWDTIGKFAKPNDLIVWLQNLGRGVFKDAVQALNEKAAKDDETKPPKDE